jgi:serine/threonine protein kinase
MQPGPETTSTAQWRAAFAEAEALEGLPVLSQREAIARLAAQDMQLAHRVGLLLGGDTVQSAAETAVTHVLGNARVTMDHLLKADDQIGAYTLIRPLGKGGMADVWLAQRSDGALKRPVALKLPMTVGPAPHLAERFARERDMLAQLDHPNVARIYDAGTSANGQPFLALEFIDGVPLDLYCHTTRSTIAQRVQLIVQVAQAVHHAHSRLVLHRDLKPSNILVTREGVVKVLDFGIAKLLTEERTAEETQFTRMAGAALTPKFAAPEQLLGETVTTSTDVFALAVLLYELLSGMVPFPNQAKELGARMSTLNSPCTLLSDNAVSQDLVQASQAGSARNVKRALAGDLTAILDKALRRAPNDRYPSALAFAEDLQRYLENQPVLARQGAVVYRARKFLIRHRMPVAVAALGALVASGFGLQAFTQAQRAAQSQQRADSIDGLMESLFQGMSPDVAAKRTFTAKELLDRASVYLTTRGTVNERATNLTNARMAALYRDIGDFQEAMRLNSVLLTNAEREKNIPNQISALRELANCAWRGNDLERAQKYVDTAQLLIKTSGSSAEIERAWLANIEGSIATRSYKYDFARSRYAEAELLWRKLEPDNVEAIAWALEGQASMDRVGGDIASAKTKLNAVMALDSKYPKRGEMDRIHTRSMLATLIYLEGRFSDANPLLKRACTEVIGRLGVNHSDAHVSCFNYAYSSIRLGAWDAAQGTIDLLDTSTSYREAAGYPVRQLNALLALYQGRAEAAEAGFREIISSFSKLENTPSIADSILRFERYAAEAALRGGKTEAACATLRRIESSFVATKGEANVDVAAVRILLTVCALRAEDRTGAKALISGATQTLRTLRGEHHPFTLAAYAYSALCNDTADRTDVLRRLRSELLWQTGTQQLITLIESKRADLSLRNTPVVL